MDVNRGRKRSWADSGGASVDTASGRSQAHRAEKLGGVRRGVQDSATDRMVHHLQLGLRRDADHSSGSPSAGNRGASDGWGGVSNGHARPVETEHAPPQPQRRIPLQPGNGWAPYSALIGSASSPTSLSADQASALAAAAAATGAKWSISIAARGIHHGTQACSFGRNVYPPPARGDKPNATGTSALSAPAMPAGGRAATPPGSAAGSGCTSAFPAASLAPSSAPSLAATLPLSEPNGGAHDSLARSLAIAHKRSWQAPPNIPCSDPPASTPPSGLTPPLAPAPQQDQAAACSAIHLGLGPLSSRIAEMQACAELSRLGRSASGVLQRSQAEREQQEQLGQLAAALGASAPQQGSETSSQVAGHMGSKVADAGKESFLGRSRLQLLLPRNGSPRLQLAQQWQQRLMWNLLPIGAGSAVDATQALLADATQGAACEKLQHELTNGAVPMESAAVALPTALWPEEARLQLTLARQEKKLRLQEELERVHALQHRILQGQQQLQLQQKLQQRLQDVAEQEAEWQGARLEDLGVPHSVQQQEPSRQEHEQLALVQDLEREFREHRAKQRKEQERVEEEQRRQQQQEQQEWQLLFNQHQQLMHHRRRPIEGPKEPSKRHMQGRQVMQGQSTRLVGSLALNDGQRLQNSPRRFDGLQPAGEGSYSRRHGLPPPKEAFSPQTGIEKDSDPRPILPERRSSSLEPFRPLAIVAAAAALTPSSEPGGHGTGRRVSSQLYASGVPGERSWPLTGSSRSVLERAAESCRIRPRCKPLGLQRGLIRDSGRKRNGPGQSLKRRTIAKEDAEQLKRLVQKCKRSAEKGEEGGEEDKPGGMRPRPAKEQCYYAPFAGSLGPQDSCSVGAKPKAISPVLQHNECRTVRHEEGPDILERVTVKKPGGSQPQSQGVKIFGTWMASGSG